MSKPEFAVRLRGKNNTWQDLVSGNSWDVTGVTGYQLDTSVGKFGGEALAFNGKTALFLNTTTKSILAQDDFTITCWVKTTQTYGSTNYPTVYESYIGYSYAMICLLSSRYPATTDKLNIWWDKGNQAVSTNTNISITDGNWHYLTLTQKNGIKYLLVDGVLITSTSHVLPNYNILLPPLSGHLVVGSMSGDSGQIPSNYGDEDYFEGLIDDFCILDTALWTDSFTPPMGYLSLKSTVYLTGQEAWGINGSGNFAKLSNNYSAMTPAEKIAMFDATAGQLPTIAELKTLTMPIKAVNYNCENTQPTCTVTAISKPQTVTPKGRISLKNYAKLKGVSITGATSGNGSVKVAVTKDNSTYQVYDSTNLAWVDINIADIGTDGMSLSDVAALTTTEWAAYDCIDSGIGFAYYLEMTSTSDTAYTDELTLNVELLGELKSLTKGTDYNYSYVSNDVLQVKLYKNGNFRINYNPGDN